MLPVLGGSAVVTASAAGVAGHVAARLLGLRPGRPVIGSLTIDHVDGERWTREFGGRSWVSTLTPEEGDAFIERCGPLRLCFDVRLDAAWDTRLLLRSVHLGRLRLRVGRHIAATGRIAADGTTDIALRVPGGRCGYHVEFGGEG